MEFVLSKFRKSKPSAKDRLEEIDKELGKLARYQFDTELQQKRIIGRVVVGSIFLYCLILALVYFIGLKDLTWQQTVLGAAPLILFPFIVVLIKRILSWYFNRKIDKNKKKYKGLKEEKQKLLDDVMENETFKVAKEILEKHAPNQLRPKDEQRASPGGLTPLSRGAPGLRRRTNLAITGTSTPVPYNSMGGFTPRNIRPYGPQGPVPGQFLRQPTNNFGRLPAIMPPPGALGPSPPPGAFPRGPPPPRFMLPPPPSNPQFRSRKTGWIDKLVDYVVGDGPANRFALICRYCATHNGLATPDDFPYIGYKCVHCRQFNPPRQQRPSAQTLPRNTVLIEEMDSTIRSPDTSVNGDIEGDKTENKDNDNEAQSGSEEQEAGEKSEEVGNRDNEGEGPIVELAASSVEDLRRSSDSLREDREQSVNEDSENDDRSSQIDPASTTNDHETQKESSGDFNAKSDTVGAENSEQSTTAQ